MKKPMYKLSAYLMALALSGGLLLSPGEARAQVPQKFNYQGIARDAKGNPMSQKTMSLKLSVLPTADATSPEYEEIQSVTTNEFGLYTLQIGAGQAITGEMKTVKWETGNKYIRVAIDPMGGTNYSDAGTTQLLSVPYAIYADRAGMAKSSGDRTGAVNSNATHVVGDTNYVTKFTGLNTIGKSSIYDNGTNVGIGTGNTPNSGAVLHLKRSTSGNYLYMENTSSTSFGTFRMINDDPSKFATFSKYGSAAVGGYTGIASMYPFANMLGFGNNGPFLNAGSGNIGFAITKAGTNKLKIHIDYASERMGLGGNSTPQAQVHFNNTDAGNDTIKFTNQTTGHLAGDGTELRTNGNNTRLTNRENGFIILGTNNTDRLAINGAGQVGIGTVAPLAGSALDVNGQVRISGGAPGAGKVLTSDANGLASWTTIAGLNGKTVLNGTTAPSNAIGTDGDFYINTVTNQIFGPKAAGVWGAGTSLIGPTGATGATGPAGPAGATGATGPAGPAGATGATGATGPAGPAGPTGATGATGPVGPAGATGATGPAGPAGPAGLLTPGAAAGNTTYWDGTQWVVNSSNIYNNGGNVGIGTTAPTAKLHTTDGVRFETLSGTAIRPVFADANGNLTASTITNPAPTSSAPNGIIPDNGCGAGNGYANTITISGLPNSVSTANLVVTVNLTCIFNDQVLYLTAPNGDIIKLYQGNGSSGGDMVNTVFVNSGAPVIPAVGSPWTGNYMPNGIVGPQCGMTSNVGTFAAIGGGTINPNGSWTITGYDILGGGTPTLQNWSVDFTSVGSAPVGTPNYHPKWDASGALTSTSSVFDDGNNVGLGTASPSAKLHIQTTSGNAIAKLDAQSASDEARIEFNKWTNIFTAGVGYYPGNADLRMRNNDPSAAITFEPNATERMRINAGGEVGIGTNAPSNKLHVAGTFRSDEQLHVGMSSLLNTWYRGAFYNPNPGQGSALSLFTADAGNTPFDGGQISLSDGVNPNVEIANREAGGIAFMTNGYSEKMRLDVNGNLGIGTTAPTGNLHIETPNSVGYAGAIKLIAPNLAGASQTVIMQGKDNGTANQAEYRFEYVAPNSPLNAHAFGFSNIQPFVFFNAAENVGIGVSNPAAKLDVNGQVKISGGSPGVGKVLTSDATGLATWTTLPAAGVSGSGTTNYIPKFTAGTAIGNSQIQDNGTSLGVGIAPTLQYQMYVYRQQQTANGDGQHSLFGYRTRNSQNDGISYGQSGTNSATGGYNFWGDVYTFGVAGHSYNDYSRTGGVLGAEVSGAYWGSLGYRSSGLLNYGVYGSAAYASGAGLLPNTPVNGIGGGFFGTIGSLSKGSVIGQLNEGELFAAYNNGDVYTAGKQVELVAANDKMIPSYAVTSYEAKIYNNGKVQMVNGTATVRFDENYTALLGETPVVTVSPMGACNGVYITEVTKDGFIIKEQNGGTSSVEISWITVGSRIDAKANEVPEMLTSTSFNKNLSKALFNDGNKKQSAMGMWWNGKTLQFGEMPANMKVVARPEQDHADRK